jgi:nucleobase:cation symporter-1, NCS1 family
MIAVLISTLATNIAANIVSPANDFANLNPSKISFKTGGYITGIIGILICPWKLIADPSGYIFTWLVGYSSLLGPVGGIMIVDYYFIRKTHLDLKALYTEGSLYSYKNGFNSAAIIALCMGIVPNVFGFLKAIHVVSATAFPDWLTQLYSYAWFVGFGVSAIVYWFLMRRKAQIG